MRLRGVVRRQWLFGMLLGRFRVLWLLVDQWVVVVRLVGLLDFRPF